MRDGMEYLREKKQLLLYAALSAGTLLSVYWLAGFPAQAVLYAALLQLFILFVILLPGYFSFRARKKALADFQSVIFESEAALPAPRTPLEEKYQALILSARTEYNTLKRREEDAQNDSLTYYTLWVHQIKTPIAAMRLILDGEGDVKPKLRQELFKVERYADLALQYVKLREILTDLVIEPCDLYALVRESVKKYAVLFVYQRLTVTIEPFEETVMSDKKWVLFILEQLLSNAVKYTKTGGVTVFYRDGALHVTDTGVGIRAQDVPLVFEKGYTGYNGRTDGRASGIGQYLTKKVCDALSVRISILSEPGRGTDVTLRFPQSRSM